MSGAQSKDVQPQRKSTRKHFLLFGLLLFFVAGVYVYFFGGPYRFVDVPLAEDPMQHLRSSARGAPWSSSPAEAALEYLGWWPSLDDTNRSKLNITTSFRSSDEAVVTIIDNDTRDDSVSRTCDRLTLRRQSGVWLPIRHQQAWQGRGRFGWTTKPAS
jgi:hypothetical protein